MQFDFSAGVTKDSKPRLTSKGQRQRVHSVEVGAHGCVAWLGLACNEAGLHQMQVRDGHIFVRDSTLAGGSYCTGWMRS